MAQVGDTPMQKSGREVEELGRESKRGRRRATAGWK